MAWHSVDGRRVGIGAEPIDALRSRLRCFWSLCTPLSPTYRCITWSNKHITHIHQNVFLWAAKHARTIGTHTPIHDTSRAASHMAGTHGQVNYARW